MKHHFLTLKSALLAWVILLTLGCNGTSGENGENPFEEDNTLRYPHFQSQF